MRISLRSSDGAGIDGRLAVDRLVGELVTLGFDAGPASDAAPGETRDGVCITLSATDDPDDRYAYRLALEPAETRLERALRLLPLDFDTLPLLVEGESKVVRLWTDRTVVTRLKPTVYSYTENRYGVAPGTDDIRARFTAAVFRQLRDRPPAGSCHPRSAFLAELPRPQGRLLVERRVETCNLETRVKRYHIGSPVHRYRFTERYPSTQRCRAIGRWSRLDEPVVCFDWRHPLVDEAGQRLADEPISDDYAGVWMFNVDDAKQMARQVFLWLEALLEASGVRLIDFCLLIDRQGQTIYGELSPDCMRVRLGLGHPAESEEAAKDVWRAGGSPAALRQNYEQIYRQVFGADAGDEERELAGSGDRRRAIAYLS